MKINLSKYQTIVFDCDGVILNSNQIKTNAFFQVALPFGRSAAEALVLYHTENGGVSRYEKFNHFASKIAPKFGYDLDVKQLINHYESVLDKALITCEMTQSLNSLKKITQGIPWCVVSGSDQEELRSVFEARALTNLFNGGIFGSPNSKVVILKRLIDNGVISLPALYLGDSSYDHIAATQCGLDFIFVSGWTELRAWEDYCTLNQLHSIESIADLV